MLPTIYEVVEVIEEVQRYTKITTGELTKRFGFPVRPLKGRIEPLSAYQLRCVKGALLWSIKHNLDPFYPGGPGADREWTEVVRALRMYLTARVEHALTLETPDG